MGAVLYTYTYDDENMYFLDRKINYYDVVKYYIEENHSKVETYTYFNLTRAGLSKFIKHFDIKKPRILSHEHNKKTCLEKYGDPNYNNFEQYKKTCLEKYGVENVFQHQETIDKIKETHVRDYGSLDEYYKNRDNNMKATMIERYGDWYARTEECKEKKRQTCLKHFGVEYPMQSKDVKNKYNFKKNSEKAFQSKIKHNTTNTSKPQKTLIASLQEIFGENNVYSEYKEERYPYYCDAYVKPLDLFIELNLYFTHGASKGRKPHLFNPNDENDIKTLNEWQQLAKTSKFYENAIQVWTVRDVEKHNTAKRNNLNYIALYSVDEMNQLLSTLKEKSNNNEN